MKLRVVIERITYQNGENGYSILKARVKGYDDLVTLVGNMLDVTVGTVLVADGQWKVNRQYGSQFVVVTYEEAMPATLFGLEKYLGSGLVKGIGPKFSKLIVAKFGMDTFDIIEKDCQRLGEVDGIGPKRIKKIHDSWMKQLDIKDVMVFLQGNGVSTAYAAKIYKAYGKESIDTVKSNPYCLADDIMEPYRPYVDRLVYDITEQYGIDIELSKDIKAELLSIPTLDVVIGGKRSPLMVATAQTTASLYKCFSGELRKIAYPEM